MTDTDNTDTDSVERFVQHLTEHQNRLFAYIYSLLADHTRAADVLQETNLVLWRKHREFAADRPFLPWAFAVARNQVLANLRDKKRDKCLLDAELVAAVAAESEKQASQFDAMQVALRNCLERLAPNHRELIRQRYDNGLSIREVAELTGRGGSAIKVTLMRARRQLATCVQRQIATDAS